MTLEKHSANHQFSHNQCRMQHWKDKWSIIREIEGGDGVTDEAIVTRILTHDKTRKTAEYNSLKELESEISKTSGKDQYSDQHTLDRQRLLEMIKKQNGRIFTWHTAKFKKPLHLQNRVFFEQVFRRYMYDSFDECIETQRDPAKIFCDATGAEFALGLDEIYRDRFNNACRNGRLKGISENIDQLNQVESASETIVSILSTAVKTTAAAITKTPQKTRKSIHPVTENSGYNVHFQSGNTGLYPQESKKLLAKDIYSKQRVDQHHLWTNAECASAWFKLIDYDMYKKYRDCVNTLHGLISRSEFSDIYQLNQINNVVMLGGGGAFGKDRVMLCRLPKLSGATNDNPLPYKILDFSTWMLEAAYDNIAKTKEDFPEISLAQDIYIKGDFFRLADLSAKLKEPGHRSLWAITGGTLGNINEDKFLDSLNEVASPKDLLILSASTYENDSVIASGDYNNDYVRNILYPVIAQMLVHFPNFEIADGGNPIESIWNTHHSSISHEVGVDITTVPGSQTELLKVLINGKDVTLLNHTHYSIQDLIRFVENKGWRHVIKQENEGDVKRFHQFLFEKL